MRALLSKAATVALLLMVGLILGAAINGAAARSAAAEVYAACMQAHYETDGPSEQHCGDLQDRYNIEFLCDQTSTHCWTEVK